MFDERLKGAAQRVLAGDDSMSAAHQLEAVLLDDYPGDQRFDDLLEALALYAPGQGPPYVAPGALRSAIREALASLNDSSADAD